MIVDVKTQTISLQIGPEDYQVYYYLHGDPYKSHYLSYLTGRLTFTPLKEDTYSTSIFDFFIFLQKIYGLGLPECQLTTLAMEVCTKFINLRQELANIKDGAWNSRISTTLLNAPYEDQKKAIAFILARAYAGNFSSVGIGKTLSALSVFNILQNQKKISNGLVFCLNQNKLTWRNELAKHTNYDAVIVGNGTKNVLRDIDSFNGQDLLIVHYDALLSEDVKSALAGLRFDFWILDEAHILRNYGKTKYNKKLRVHEPTCQRATSVFELKDSMNPHYIVPLTGTPVPENPQQAFPVLKLLAPKQIPNRTRFEEHFCNFIHIPAKGNKRFKIKVINKAKPYKNLDELAFLMELYSFRMTQDQVKDFPPTIISIREVQLNNDQQQLYNRIEDETFKDIAAQPDKVINLDSVLIKTLRARQFLSDPELLGESVSNTKVEVLDEMLEEIMDDPTQKVVLFSSFRPVLDKLTLRYREKYGAVLYAGANKDLGIDERDLNVQLFINDPRIRLLVHNTSLGIGGNYGQVARYGIFLDLPNERLFIKQSIGRITRRDAKGTSNIMFLLGADTVDMKIWNALCAKNEMSDLLIGQDQTVEISTDQFIKRN